MDWPICLYDFTIKARCPNYFVFKVYQPLTSFEISNYFDYSTGGRYEPACATIIDQHGLVIERNYHLCSVPQFENNFKAMMRSDELIKSDSVS